MSSPFSKSFRIGKRNRHFPVTEKQIYNDKFVVISSVTRMSSHMNNQINLRLCLAFTSISSQAERSTVQSDSIGDEMSERTRYV